MSEPHRVWLNLGTRYFLAAPVLLAFLAWTVATALYFEVIVAHGPLLPWLAATLGSSCATLVALALVNRWAIRRWPGGPGPAIAVTTYAIAGAIRGNALALLAVRFDLATSITPTVRVLQSAVWAVGVMGCAGIVVARYSQHRNAMQQLAERQHELVILQSTLSERIEHTRQDLTAQVRQALEPTLAQLRARLDDLARATGAASDTAIHDFRTAVSEVVRPLSRDLAERSDNTSDPVASPRVLVDGTANGCVPFSLVVQPTASVLLLGAFVLMLATVLTPDAYRSATNPVRLALLAVLLWIALRALKSTAHRIGWQLSVSVTLISLTIAYAVVAAAIGAITRLATSELSGPSLTFPALAVALTALAPLSVSAAVILQQLADRAEEDRAETVDQLEALTAVLRRDLWRERRRLALTVHGPIQSALVAAAVTMSQPGFTANQVPALAASLDQAMAHIDRTARPPTSVVAAARDLSALWVDTASLTFTCSPYARTLIDVDDALHAVVVEVMREGVSNAIRHGAADAITISIDDSGDGTIVMVLDDNGDGPPSVHTRGLGSAMLDEIAFRWSLTKESTATRLRVELAVTNDRAALPNISPGTTARIGS